MEELNEIWEEINEIGNKEYIRFGKVSAIDWKGTEPSNKEGIAPGVKVIIQEGEEHEGTWFRLGTRKFATGGTEYIPLDVGERVVVVCPGGRESQGIVAFSLTGIPLAALRLALEKDTDAEITEDERANVRTIEFGGMVFSMDRRADEKVIKLKTPDGRYFVIQDKKDAEGLTLTSPKGSLIAISDVDEQERITIQHKEGQTILMDENGNLIITTKNWTTNAEDWTINASHDAKIIAQNESTLQGIIKAMVKGALVELGDVPIGGVVTDQTQMLLSNGAPVQACTKVTAGP